MITTSLLPNGDVLITFMIDDVRPDTIAVREGLPRTLIESA